MLPIKSYSFPNSIILWHIKFDQVGNTSLVANKITLKPILPSFIIMYSFPRDGNEDKCLRMLFK